MLSPSPVSRAHIDRWHHPWESAKQSQCAKEKKGRGWMGVAPVPHSLEPLRLFDRRDISTKAAAAR